MINLLSFAKRDLDGKMFFVVLVNLFGGNPKEGRRLSTFIIFFINLTSSFEKQALRK